MTSCQGAAGTGTLYSYAQLEGLWINAGGSQQLAPVMAAIALAESGGCSTAQNPSGATGLWQILGAVNPADQPRLTDPATNAHEAVLKWQSQGLGAWETYTNGAYRGFLSGGTTPDTNVPGGQSATLTAAQTQQASAGSDCALSLGGQHIGILFGHGPSLPSACLVRKTEVRAIMGGLLMLVGSVPFLLGALIVAAGAFTETKTGRAAARGVGRAAEVIPAVRVARVAAPRPRPQPQAQPQPRQAPARRAEPQSTGGRKIRTGRGQVSEDFASRYGTA